MSLESTQIELSNESENETEKLSFHEACTEGDLNLVKVYVAQKGFDINVGNLFGRTGFHWACWNGKLNVVQFLVEKGCDMNVRDDYGRTGFHFACLDGNLNVVQFLLQQGFEGINEPDFDGKTGFHWACYNGHLNVAQFLVQKGFDWNVVDNYGRTGFYLACLNGRLNVVQFLVQQGFEGINETVFDGKTGLKCLIVHRRRLSKNELFIPCILLLIESGAQMDENDVFENLLSAIQNRIIEITFMKETIFEKWTGRIAQAITDYAIHPFTNTSLQNLSQILD